MPEQLKSFRAWAHGLCAAIIGGGANAIAVIVVDPLTFNLDDGIGNLLKVAAVSAIVSAAAYLKRSPLPGKEEQQ